MNATMRKHIFIIMIALLLSFAITSCQRSTFAVPKTLKVSYIDVGQADSILIQSNGANMLIDAGNREDKNTVINYLKKQGVKKLDVVIGTHPHEDHIGGMSAVLNTFKADKIIMPKVTNNTETFKELITVIKSKGLKITNPKPGAIFKVGNATCTILAPNSSKYDDLNNYSVVIRMTYGNNSFLFEGDAEVQSEKEMLNWRLQ